ncbi:hypothetical protein Smp_136780 [Schistosoma mansoni]|uniref:hypothetical protein n=1 Tax=Schistosoma mansoni TaxID=6183 RepID=UPI00022DC630|nr:hypothetical protein Smp_136780 [Schistosoma mansoni]|eukprot:XP_018651466.1 hypothetical protein Smp_136780 [Schistosoma mansoni]
MSLMNPYGTIIEGIGNELLFVLSCMGTILFLIVAWISTRVNWELMPVRITLLRHLHSNHDTGAETTNAPGTVEPDNIDSSGNIFAESSGSSSEDEINSDTCVHKRSSVQTSVSLTDQRNSSSSDEESKKSRTKENGKINSTSCSNGHLVIKLQYLNEESRFVHASPTMSVNLSTFALVTLTVFFCGAVFTATLVNVVSTIASLFGISNSNELSNQQSENPINQPDSPDVQVLTVTMVARRVPPQTSVNQTNSTSFFLGESAHNHQIIVDEPNSESQTRTD